MFIHMGRPWFIVSSERLVINDKMNTHIYEISDIHYFVIISHERREVTETDTKKTHQDMGK